MKTITQVLTKADYTMQVSFAVGYFGSIPTKVVPCPEGALILEVKHPLEWTDDTARPLTERSGRVVGHEGVLSEPRKWPDPPHVALANWQFDSAESVCTFVKRYGVLLFDGQVPKVIRPSDLRVYQEALRAAWRTTSEDVSPRDASEAVRVLEKEFSLDDLRSPWGNQNYFILYEPWSLACFLFLRDLAKGDLAVCLNLNCANPYFIKARSDQQFCSPECRNTVNVQRWRSMPKNKKRERLARQKREGKA